MKMIMTLVRRRERGSALLVTLMVMAGLSLLGLGFVAISETESAISVNDRNYVQAQAAAETGVRTVVEMLQDAPWTADIGVLPQNTNDFKTLRSSQDGSIKDYYKPVGSQVLFDVPFKPSRTDRFLGADPDHADVWIADTFPNGTPNAKGKAYLDKLSAKIFYQPPGSTEQLRISDIRVFAPPIPGVLPETYANGYYDTDKPRYGVATIRVTAQKLVNGVVRAERTVKAVVAETPFPTVDGAIETAGSLVGQGSFRVYWGKVLSEKSMALKRAASGLPWFDALHSMTFEYGYDTTAQRKDDTTYAVGDVVHAPDSFILLDPDLAKFAFQAKTVTGKSAPAASAPTIDKWQAAMVIDTGTVVDGGVTWVATYSRPFRFNSSITDPLSDFYINRPWLQQLVEQSLGDPWLHARARETVQYGTPTVVPCGSATLPHPCDYDKASWDVSSRYSNIFQNQNANNPPADGAPADKPERMIASFPSMDYEFWKAVAQANSNQPGSGIYYFAYAGDGTNNLFTGPGGATKDVLEWLNAAPDANNKPMNGLGSGFYFFDTKNGKNPQFGKGGTLSPPIDVGAKVKTPFQMRGYIYLNAISFGTSGQGSITDDDVYAMPGEPYRDVGYREIETTGPNKGNFRILGGSGTLPSGNYVVLGANNGVWDYQEVNDNGYFDVWVEDISKGGTATTANGVPLPVPTYAPVPYYPGCQVPDLYSATQVIPAAGKGCSEPHEPFLNLIYPIVDDYKNGKDPTIWVHWYPNIIDDATAAKFRRPKKRTGKNTTVTCTAKSTPAECTSNGYDLDGALVRLDPLLWGALYNEGLYDSQGNARYYGSLLFAGTFQGTGTPDVFFDECLARGCLESQLKMQRVMISSMETDQP
jgi:hypothetical protein